MAVHSSLEFKNLKASVVVDGRSLPCHASFVDKKEKSVSCWIASEESKHFLVRLKRGDKTCSIRASLFLDGKRVKRKFLSQKEACTSLRFDRVQTSKDTTRPFMFAPLEVTDDDKYLDASLLSSDNVKIGEITIEVHRVARLKYVKKIRQENVKEPNYSRKDLHVQMVHETSKKAITMSHQIGYGEEKEISHSNDPYYSCVQYSAVKELIAKFTFRYRPIETLVSCGIVPPLSQPVEAKEKEAQQSQELEPPLPTANQSTHEQMDDRHEDTSDDIYVLPLTEPIAAIGTEDANIHNESGERAPLSNAQQVQDTEETKLGLISDEEYEDENDEEIQALQARTLKLLEEKRKRREAVQGPRKRIKLEEAPLVFFHLGEVREVIDLT